MVHVLTLFIGLHLSVYSFTNPHCSAKRDRYSSSSEGKRVCMWLCFFFRLFVVFLDCIKFLLVDRSEIGWGKQMGLPKRINKWELIKEKRRNIDAFHSSLTCLDLFKEWILSKRDWKYLSLWTALLLIYFKAWFKSI